MISTNNLTNLRVPYFENELKRFEEKWVGKIHEESDPLPNNPYPAQIVQNEARELMSEYGYRYVSDTDLEFEIHNKSMLIQAYEPDTALIFTYVPAAASNGYKFQQLKSVRMVTL